MCMCSAKLLSQFKAHDSSPQPGELGQSHLFSLPYQTLARGKSLWLSSLLDLDYTFFCFLPQYGYAFLNFKENRTDSYGLIDTVIRTLVLNGHGPPLGFMQPAWLLVKASVTTKLPTKEQQPWCLTHTHTHTHTQNPPLNLQATKAADLSLWVNCAHHLSASFLHLGAHCHKHLP
jgi:hypothetical protein